MKNRTGQTLMTCIQFLIFAWLSLIGYPRIFIYSLGTYLNPFYTACVYSAVCLLFILASRNPVLSKMKYGSAVKCMLIIEFYLLLLFAQKHLVLAVITILLSVGVGVMLHYWVRRQNARAIQSSHQNLKRCKQTANALLCVAASILFLIPSLIGLIGEFDTITPEEWDAFVEKYSNEAASVIQPEKDVFKAHPDVPEKIASWSELSTKEKTQLVQIIALMEQEHLGIQDLAEAVVIVDKLDEYECGHYLDSEKTIAIDVGHLTTAPVEEVIATVAEEVFHRYQYAVVEILDFDNKEIDGLLYFNDAKKWSENMQNYIDGRVNYDLYIRQPIENDARTFSEERVKVYMEMAAKTESETQ